MRTPHAVQWLSDNGLQHTTTATVLYAHRVGPGTDHHAGVQS